MSGDWWAFIFLMLIMKVPIVYLAGVVWYACKAPDPPEPAVKLVEAPEPEPFCPWRLRRRDPTRPRRPWAPSPRVGRSPRLSRAHARHE
jgi:predicted membrane channel-forming protein YqfA (hemolysin III family)